MVKDRFSPNDPIPLFLSGPVEEAEQSRARKAVSSGGVRKAVLVFAAAAAVFAVLSVGTVILFASVTASEVSTPVARDSTSHSTPAIQTATTAEISPVAPPSNELLAAFKVALENKAEVDQPKVDPPKAGALINQFQAWAAEEDSQVPARPPQPVEDARAEVVHNPPLPRRRPVHIEQTARAQDPLPQNTQSFIRHFGWRN
jgi:hypothetical protein